VMAADKLLGNMGLLLGVLRGLVTSGGGERA
jgi:hypothetical protein